MKTILAACATILLSAFLFPAQGQKKSADVTRAVSGVVTVGDAAPAAGAVVYLKNTKSLEVRTFYAKAETGEYRFSGLSPDVDYELHAEFKGQKSPGKTLSSFDSRKQAVVNLKVPAGPSAPAGK
jgi:hypothetical protein